MAWEIDVEFDERGEGEEMRTERRNTHVINMRQGKRCKWGRGFHHARSEASHPEK